MKATAYESYTNNRANMQWPFFHSFLVMTSESQHLLYLRFDRVVRDSEYLILKGLSEIWNTLYLIGFSAKFEISYILDRVVRNSDYPILIGLSEIRNTLYLIGLSEIRNTLYLIGLSEIRNNLYLIGLSKIRNTLYLIGLSEIRNTLY